MMKPHARNTDAGSPTNVGLEVVPDHPRIAGRYVQTSEGLSEHARMGFTYTPLSLYENNFEISFEFVPFQLPALELGATVGEQTQAITSPAKLREHRERVPERCNGVLLSVGVSVSYLLDPFARQFPSELRQRKR